MAASSARRLLPLALAAVFAVLSHESSARTQQSPRDPAEPARLTITVRDPDGVVPHAAVDVTSRPSRQVLRLVTDASGVAATWLPPGVYDIRASVEGFADGVANAVIIEAGRPRDITIPLSLAQFSTEVTVTTANRREELLLRVPDPVTLLDRSELRDTGARTAKDVLSEQVGAGVQVNVGGGQGHVSINGIPNSGVLVLVDGRRVLGKDANGNLNLEDIQLAGVDRIEIVKGAGSAIYGSDALGGVINLITARATKPGPSNQVLFSGGTYRDLRVSDAFDYRRGPGSFGASGSYRNYDGFDLDPVNPQTIGQPESRFATAGGYGNLRVSPRLDLRVAGDFWRRRIDNYFFSGATQLASTVYNSKRRLTRYSVAPEVNLLVGPRTAVTAAFTAGKYDRDERQVFPDRQVVPVPWQEWNREAKLTGSHAFQALGRDHPLQAGYEFRRETLDRASLAIPGRPDSRASRDFHVGWLQQELALTSRLKATAGFRFDEATDFGSQWSPKAGVAYGVAPAHTLRASFGEGFRAPYFGELYLSTFGFVGNPALRPEQSRTFSAGYTYGGARLQAAVDYFRARVRDGIAFDLRRLPFTYVNLREYTSAGTNLAVSTALPLGLTPSFSYAYVRREDDDGVVVGGLPEHSALVKLLWVNTRLGLRANLRGRFLDEVRFEDGTSQPAYQVWHARVERRVAAGGGYEVRAFVQADNLFDRRNIFKRSASGEPIPGDFQVWLAPRTFLAGFSLDLDGGGGRSR